MERSRKLGEEKNTVNTDGNGGKKRNERKKKWRGTNRLENMEELVIDAEGQAITWDALEETGNSRWAQHKGEGKVETPCGLPDAAESVCDVPKPPTARNYTAHASACWGFFPRPLPTAARRCDQRWEGSRLHESHIACTASCILICL